ncbi:MAG: hypothetical protein KatS3mg095_0057 [Candidatus Parcubacteria bacterium]|nr:MAG: hypothetical protein KatS3mg095_0057 [Candidatus Parcubacteria bacterium]
MDNNFLQEITKIKNLNINIIESSQEFYFIDNNELLSYLNFIKYLQDTEKFYLNLNLSEEEIKKCTIIYLLIRNLVNKNNKDDNIIKNKIQSLKLIRSLDDSYQDNILKTYIISGIYFIKANIDHPIINFKKSLLKHFHDIGGFNPDIWGFNFNLALFKEIIDKNNLETIFKKYKNINWQQFYMLTYL